MTVSHISKQDSKKNSSLKKFIKNHTFFDLKGEYDGIVFFHDDDEVYSALKYSIPYKQKDTQNSIYFYQDPIELLGIESYPPRYKYGTKIMLKLFHIAVREQRDIELYCSEGNSAENFFSSLGFKKKISGLNNYRIDLSDIKKIILKIESELRV